jgi:K+ transporter
MNLTAKTSEPPTLVFRLYIILHPDPNSITWHRDLWLVKYLHCERPSVIQERAFQTLAEAMEFSTVPLDCNFARRQAMYAALEMLDQHARNINQARFPHSIVIQVESIGDEDSEFLEREVVTSPRHT